MSVAADIAQKQSIRRIGSKRQVDRSFAAASRPFTMASLLALRFGELSWREKKSHSLGKNGGQLYLQQAPLFGPSEASC